ncbi:unnamed protein product [Allacma fusca]|uniref:Peptidase S1 domain-containing protein n=1 Tax=Allacma fusca TaxID=39272 RepID=A0A8J2L9I7_9HEXA|nr:unnamed protein product [Allacma fusca]
MKIWVFLGFVAVAYASSAEETTNFPVERVEVLDELPTHTFNLKTLYWIGTNVTNVVVPESPSELNKLNIASASPAGVKLNIASAPDTIDEVTPELRTKGVPEYCRCAQEYYCLPPMKKIPARAERAINTPVCRRGEVMCCTTSGPGCGVTDPFPYFHPYPSYGEANYAEYPWTALVMDTSNQYVFGLGTIVSPRLILTSARNLEPYIGTPLKVRLGEWDLAGEEPFKPVEISVQEAIIHPQFNKRTFQNDIALLKLRTPVDLGSYPQIRSACLVRPEEIGSLQNARCWTAGWGQKPSQRQAPAPVQNQRNILKEVDMNIVDPKSCEAAIRRSIGNPQYYFDQKSFLCAGGEAGKGLCKGDEGAALICQDRPGERFKVVGISSWGATCGQAGFPGIFTNLATLYDWIRSVDANVG